MTETDIELIEGLRKQSPKAQQQMLDRHDPSVMPQSLDGEHAWAVAVKALGRLPLGYAAFTKRSD